MSVAANEIVRSDTTPAVSERVLIVEDDAAARVGLEQLVKSWGFVAESAADGEDALEKVTTLPAGHRHLRPGDAADGRPRAAARAAVAGRRRHDAAADGAGHGRDRRRGDEGRRLRLPDQAGRHPAAEDPARQDRRAAGDAPRSEGAAAAAARARHVRADDRQQPRDAEDLPGDRAGGADQRVGADHRRVGHRQGARRADDPPAQPARGVSVRRDQLRGDSRDAARERDLRPREGRVHRRRRSPAGLLRAGRSRHAVPRRDRRDDAGDAGEAAARAAGADASAGSAAATSSRSTCA